MASTLGAFMEERDDDTGRHVQRVAAISRFIAIKYGLSLDDVELIYRAAPFHDAGKVSIPDNILKKADVFEDNEWEIMKTHAIKGYEIFKDAKSPMLKMAAIIAKEHHERWDGKGYPFGLKGEEISIAGRIVILADIFDALIHKRVYKDAWDIQDAIEYIQNNRAKIFEPKMVDILLENTDEFIEIVNSLSDD
jgi:response regulator RpfG family c-di-GMP phosphodiesterase